MPGILYGSIGCCGDGMSSGTGKYERLLERCAGLPPVLTAVAHPCEQGALAGALEAAGIGLIKPILVGPRKTIEKIAVASGMDLGATEILDTAHSHDSAAAAAGLIR